MAQACGLILDVRALCNAFQLVGTRLRRIVRRSFTEAWEPVEDSSRVWESLRAQVSDCEVSVEQLQVSLAKLPQINSFHLGPLLEALTLHMDAHGKDLWKHGNTVLTVGKTSPRPGIGSSPRLPPCRWPF